MIRGVMYLEPPTWTQSEQYTLNSKLQNHQVCLAILTRAENSSSSSPFSGEVQK